MSPVSHYRDHIGVGRPSVKLVPTPRKQKKEGSELPIAQQFQPIRTSQIIFRTKSPKSVGHVFVKSRSAAREETDRPIPNKKTSKYVMVQVR